MAQGVELEKYGFIRRDNMALTVATNTGALMAQAAAASVNKEMETSMSRLSTGKRINSASDDAAGVAIASRLSADIKGTNVAIRNAMDAQGLIDTAEGAQVEVTNILQRMREVAVQSLNDTNSQKDRDALQLEMNQLKLEVDRIAHSTTWAGTQILNGTETTNVADATTASKDLTFQVGSGTLSTQSLTLSIDNTSAAKLSLSGTGTATVTKTEDQTAVQYPSVSHGTIAGANKGSLAFAINATNGEVTVTKGGTPAANGDYTVTLVVDGVSVAFDGFDDGVQKGFNMGTDAGVAQAVSAKLTASTALQAKGVSITHAAGAAKFVVSKGGAATLDVATANQIKVADFTNGENFKVTIDGTEVAVTASNTDGYADTRAGLVQQITDKINAANIVGITATANTANNRVDLTKAQGLTINSGNFATRSAVIGTIDTALETVSTQRAKLGAMSNRLDNTVSNLTNMSTNLSAARGRIEDADFAAETTNLAKTQILQQASTAMLAQANASKQNVLSLLQG
jgi:flagellin